MQPLLLAKGGASLQWRHDAAIATLHMLQRHQQWASIGSARGLRELFIVRSPLTHSPRCLLAGSTTP